MPLEGPQTTGGWAVANKAVGTKGGPAVGHTGRGGASARPRPDADAAQRVGTSTGGSGGNGVVADTARRLAPANFQLSGVTSGFTAETPDLPGFGPLSRFQHVFAVEFCG
jgi:hypothetical protein